MKIVSLLIKLVWLMAGISLIVGWLLAEKRKDALINKYIDAELFDETKENLFTNEFKTLGIGSAIGFGGELQSLVTIQDSTISNFQVIKQTETSIYFSQCKPIIKQLQNRKLSEYPNHPDAISGATLTSMAIIDSFKEVEAKYLGVTLDKQRNIQVSIATPWIILLILLSVSTLFIKKRIFGRILDWLILIASLFIIGFWMNKPLTLTFFTQILLFNPINLFSNIDIYLLLIYALAVIILFRRNLYCKHLCPFGAFQDCATLAMKPSGKIKLPKWIYQLPLLLTGIALIPAFLSNAPGLANYEIYSGVFDFRMSYFLYALLVITLILMFIVKRPWCRIFCPVGALLNQLSKINSQLNTQNSTQAKNW